MGVITMMIYDKKDWLNYATEFDYSNDIGKKENVKLKKQMQDWNIKSFQEFFGFKGIDELGYYIK
jgi:hypothetical protein